MIGRRWYGLAVQAAMVMLGAAMMLALLAADGAAGYQQVWAQAEPTPVATPIAPVPLATAPASDATPPAATVPAPEGTAPATSATPNPGNAPLPTATATGALAATATPGVTAGEAAPVPPTTAMDASAGASGGAVGGAPPSSGASANGMPSTDGAAGPGRVLYADNFTSPTSGWPVESSDAATRRVGYADGEYLVARLPGSGGSPYVMREERFGDFFLQVDARLTEPTIDAYVFVDFRRQESGEHYSFVVAPDEGAFIVRRNTDREGVTIFDWTRSAAIKRGAATNRLGVRVQGAEVTLFVNGEEVGRSRADELREGGIGFGVGSLGDGAAEARFANLVVVSVE